MDGVDLRLDPLDWEPYSTLREAVSIAGVLHSVATINVVFHVETEVKFVSPQL